ncbi:MAG: HAMP domain-containing sensor histidine kinase [Acidimicrobiales bacterium]
MSVRRRLTLRFVAVVALALLVGGGGALLLATVQARRSAQSQLRGDAAAVAANLDGAGGLNLLRQTTRVLRLQGAEVVGLGPGGRVVSGSLPEGVRLADIDVPALQRGEVVGGVRARRLFAAAPVTLARPGVGGKAGREALAVVVLTRGLDSGLAGSFGYLLLATGLAVAVAAVVGDQLGRRLVAPLLATGEATRRIAAGDLEARVPIAAGEAPELARLADDVNRMAAALAVARGQERRFLLSVSHELRTPMTSIRGFAEAIADGTAPDPPRAAAVIASEAQRLERLVADLLQLATLDARAFSLSPRPVDLLEVVADAAAGLEPLAARHGLRLEGAEPDDGAAPVMVVADPDRLAQVVANLVENAIGFAGSSVRVRVWATGPGAGGVAVEDDGPGIAPADLPHVFDPLWRSPSRTSSRQVGTGLGLAIVAELVAAMGGQVAAAPVDGGGTRVSVLLGPAEPDPGVG